MSAWFSALLCAAAIGLSMVAGFFLTFSDFLMRSLRLAPVEAGVEVMQIINREVFRSITLVLMWSTLGVSLFLAVAAVACKLPTTSLALVVTGTSFYFFGVLVVSYARNLPMNARLASMPASDVATSTYWKHEYLERWVVWNSVRAVASGAAAACFLAALFLERS